jgi:hypothetical protein
MESWVWAVLLGLPLMAALVTLAVPCGWFRNAHAGLAYVRYKRTGYWPWWTLKADREAFESEERYCSLLRDKRSLISTFTQQRTP